MSKSDKPSPKLPQVAIQPEIHEILKKIADVRKTKLQSIVDEVLRAGLKVKRLLITEANENEVG